MGKRELVFLLLGKTGHGKSATGNTILGRAAFKASSSFNSETKVIEDGWVEFDNTILKVVDGPGLEDTDMDKVMDRDTAVKNMNTAIMKCADGVDAFLVVLRFGIRLTGEEQAALQTLKNIFGNDYLNHVIIVFTGGDTFPGSMKEEGRDISFQQWCMEQDNELFTDCGRRCVLFNNREEDEGRKRAQIQELVTLAEGLGSYTSECFELARAERERMIIELKAPELKKEIQKQIALLHADMDMYVKNPNVALQDKIRQRLKEMKAQLEAEDRGYGVLTNLREIVERAEQNLNDLVKLASLSKELEEIRQAKQTMAQAGAVVAVFESLATGICPAIRSVTNAVKVVKVLKVVEASVRIGKAVTVAGTAAGGAYYSSKENDIAKQKDEINNRRMVYRMQSDSMDTDPA